MGITKKILLITSIFVLSALSLVVIYKFSFEDFEKCLQEQQQQYNCTQYISFQSKLECQRYLMRIQTSISVDEAYQKAIDTDLPYLEKIKKTNDFKKRIRNLPYSFEEHFKDTQELAKENETFYEEIFSPTYLFCLKQ